MVVAIGADTPAIAPAQFNNTSGYYVVTMTHNGLFRIDAKTLEPVPDLVSTWKAISDTVFEFTIHQGIKFHNGEEMTSADIVASFDYGKTFPISVNSFRTLASYQVVDRYTVRIDSGTPNAGLFVDLASHPTFIMPKSLIDAGNDFNANPVGSGPFVFKEWRRGDSLSFTAFKDYFDKERAAKVESVTIRIIPEGFTRTLALEAGEIDYNVLVQPSDVNRMRSNSRYTVTQLPSAQQHIMYLNNDLPQFDSVHKRRAIGMAIDKEALAMAAWDGLVTPTWVTAPTIFDGATDEGTDRYDPQGARALLAQNNINPASLGFEIIASTEPWAIMAQVIQSNLRDIGVPVTIIRQDVATTQQRLNSGEYQAALMGFTQPSLLGFMRLVYAGFSIGTTNRSRVNDQQLNGLIFRATAEMNTNARNAILSQAVRRVNEQAYQITTHMAVLMRAYNSKLVIPEHAATDFPLYLNMAYWTD
jgi:peptide/nickel transport system substrate-binding protein